MITTALVLRPCVSGPTLFSFIALVFAATPSRAAERLLITNGTIMSMAGQEEPFVGYVAVGSDGRISAIGPGAAPAELTAASTVDATGKFVTPGFISAHSHIWQSA